ncbi:MAG: helix-turn-helix transcriptional regulator [Spirochaetes bacterium]|nr:helix-turn-helix transcriptional regulator [Spirochaetota bacterium]
MRYTKIAMNFISQNDRILDFLRFCYHEIGNKGYPGALLEAYTGLINVNRCHFARQNDSGRLDYLAEYGDSSICTLEESYKNQDPLRKRESYVKPHRIINLNLCKKQLTEIAKTVPLIEMCIKIFSLSDYLATIHPENYGLISFRFGKTELSAEEKSIFESVSSVVLQCYVLHRKLNRFETLSEIAWQLQKQSNKNPSAVITRNGDIIHNDPSFLHLLNKYNFSMKQLIHFVKNMFNKEQIDFNLLDSEYRFPVYRENSKQVSIKIDPVKIDKSVYYLVSILSVFKGDLTSITRRESEIISYIKQGCTNSMIASILGISEETVKRHISNMFMKTGTRNRIQLINRINPFGEV